MLKLGEDNTLTVDRETSVGMFLTDGEGNDVLLPNKYVFDDTKVGDEMTVFVYLDSSERIVATTLEPKIKLHQFAYLKAKENTEHGTFMNWGLEKDLFIPFREQNNELNSGKLYVVYLYLDEQTNRLVGSTRIDKHLEQENIELDEGEEVDIFFTGQGDLGWNVIINDKYKGLVYFNEVFQNITPGDYSVAYVKTIREDNKIDVSLRKYGYSGIEPFAVEILDELIANSGYIPLNDKSTPDEILIRFEMSKKAFKKAIGSLYKKKIINIKEDGIYLNEDKETKE